MRENLCSHIWFKKKKNQTLTKKGWTDKQYPEYYRNEEKYQWATENFVLLRDPQGIPVPSPQPPTRMLGFWEWAD